MVFDLDQFPIRSGLCKPEDRTVINPGMTGKNAVGFAGFQDDSGQYVHVFVNSWAATA